ATKREEADKERAAKNERDAAEQKKASLPGSVEATVTNARDTDDFSFDVILSTKDAVVHEEHVSNSETWAGIGVAPGTYRLEVVGSFKKRPARKPTVLTIKPGETTNVQLSLPAPP